MSSEIGVGKEILSHCNKCKLTLAHIIVTMKSQTVADKVMCKTCKGTHSYKDPAANTKKAISTKKILGAKPVSARKSGIPIEQLWAEAMNKTNRQSKEYTIKGIFEQGDIIAHPSFGPGVVEKVVDQNKIEVLFRDDFRILIHRK
jgi:hypothetical protein